MVRKNNVMGKHGPANAQFPRCFHFTINTCFLQQNPHYRSGSVRSLHRVVLGFFTEKIAQRDLSFFFCQNGG